MAATLSPSGTLSSTFSLSFSPIHYATQVTGANGLTTLVGTQEVDSRGTFEPIVAQVRNADGGVGALQVLSPTIRTSLLAEVQAVALDDGTAVVEWSTTSPSNTDNLISMCENSRRQACPVRR